MQRGHGLRRILDPGTVLSLLAAVVLLAGLTVATGHQAWGLALVALPVVVLLALGLCWIGVYKLWHWNRARLRAAKPSDL